MQHPTLDDEQRAAWHEEGWCVLGALSCLPMRWPAAQAELPAVYPTAEVFADRMEASGSGPSAGTAHAAGRVANKPAFPLEGMALNHLILHERLIGLAEELLGTDQLRLYQGHVTAKYSDGDDPEYEQLLHVDYGNHTLVVPRTDVGYRHLELFIYLSDVTPETAATRMVSRRLTGDIPVERTYLSLDEYAPPVRGRGARLRPVRLGAGLPARRLPPGDIADREAGRPVHAPCGLQTGGHRLARLPGLAVSGRGPGMAPVRSDTPRSDS